MKASLQKQPMYCSREYNCSSRFNQQYEKSTPSKGCFLSSLLALYLSVKGIITDLGKFISLSFSVMLMSDQSISKTSQIQFFLSFTFSGSNFPFIQNKCILPATLHNFIGTYE